jgi:hypothetical protein
MHIIQMTLVSLTFSPIRGRVAPAQRTGKNVSLINDALLRLVNGWEQDERDYGRFEGFRSSLLA